MVRVQEAVFEPQHCLAELRERAGADAGAIVTFTGYVRDYASELATATLFLEHYPGMCERVLTELGQTAQRRWPISHWSILHRVGALHREEPIVFVGVASAHRGPAFQACEFLIDALKTRAPFWKRERLADGREFWVAQADADARRTATWEAGQ